MRINNKIWNKNVLQIINENIDVNYLVYMFRPHLS